MSDGTLYFIKMKILFVVNQRSFDPIGVMQLSSILKREGIETKLAGMDVDNVLSIALIYKPDIIGFSAMSPHFSKMLRLNKELKERLNFFSLWGGHHPTFNPEIINDNSIDVVIKGEAEVSIFKVLKTMRKGIYDIENLVEDLDDLPLPDRELNELTSLRPDYSFRVAVFSRGCPYSCSFCFEHLKRKIYLGKGKLIRFKSVDKAIEEIKEVERLPHIHRKFLLVRDSTLNMNKAWLLEFLKKSKEQTSIPLNINIRADLMDEETAYAISKSNVFSVTMGMESANDEINLNVLRKKQTSKDISRASSLLNKYKIPIYFDTMIGLPFESPIMALNTYELAREHSKHLTMFTFNPYPKLELTEFAIKNKLSDGTFNEEESHHFPTPLNFIKKEKRQFEKLHDLSQFACYFRIPKWMMKVLINLPFNYKPFWWAFSNTYKRNNYNFIKFVFYAIRGYLAILKRKEGLILVLGICVWVSWMITLILLIIKFGRIK